MTTSQDARQLVAARHADMLVAATRRRLVTEARAARTASPVSGAPAAGRRGVRGLLVRLAV